MQALFRLPAVQHTVQQSARKAVAAADAVKHLNLARLLDIPLAVRQQNRAPEVLVCRNDLTKRCGKHLRVRILFLHLRDHALERFNLGGQIFSARFGALEAEAKLEILLVADEHIGQRCKFAECLGEFLLTAFPERGAVVKVEGDERTVLLRGLCQRKAALRCLMAHSRDEAGQVQDSDALLTEDALHVKIFDRKCPTNFTSTVIPETRCA